MVRMQDRSDWEAGFDRWLEPFLAALGHKGRRRWAPLYLRGLIGPGDRKSVQPMAGRVAPEDHEQLHHFIATSLWNTEPLEQVLAAKVDTLIGGEDAHLIVDDTALPKKGECSVGVAHQYCGALGKSANCQALVSLTLARDEVPIPIALRLYLPEAWATDRERRRKAAVPESISFRPKWQIALDEIKRVMAAGVSFGDVLADAGYGACAAFRQGLSELGLLWTVGVSADHLVFAKSVRAVVPARPPLGRSPSRLRVSARSRKAKDVIASLGSGAFETIQWRRGTKGPLRGDFAAIRIRVADGPAALTHRRGPGDEAWLICERRGSETKYYLSNRPQHTSLRTLARSIKARWSCEQAHQQLKEELGLDHFEGRSWHGLHHHALMTMIAFAFLQHLRLRENKDSAQQPAA
jgi:SRSO17 transposase